MTFRQRTSTRFSLFINSLFKNCVLLFIPLLLLAPYSIYRSIHDNSLSLEKNISLTLEQFDSTFDSMLSHVDNATSFFSTNPRVRLQLKKAFREPSISLESQKNIANLSLYFQNLIYTNDSLSNIFIYYKEENHRIFKPSSSALYALDAESEDELLAMWDAYPEQNTWFIPYEKELTHSAAPSRSLFILRKLYTPATAFPSGLLIFECNLNRLGKSLDKLIQYSNQTYYIFDYNGSFIYSNDTSSEMQALVREKCLNLSPEEAENLQTLKWNGEKYLWRTYSSERTDGFTYIYMVPFRQLYQSSLSLAHTYAFLTGCAILLSLLLAWIKTNREYRYLNTILDLFSHPQHALTYPLPPKLPATNPLNYITYNLVHLFLEQDYLKIQSSDKESKLQLLRLQMLQYQINPHFMHNTLNAIYWKSVQITGSENECSQMVYLLSSLMRYSLSSPDEPTTLQEEFQYIETYVEIMKNRFPDKYDVTYRLDEACAAFPTKRMLLQPLIENAIYHGIKSKPDKGFICVGARKLGRHIAVYVYDNGTGITPDKIAQLKNNLNTEFLYSSDSVGLKNTNFRLTLAYGKESSIRIKSIQNKFTLVYFFLPLDNNL